MSAPHANTKVLPFAELLELVSDEVAKRVNLAKPTAKTALQARLWCVWLNREVLK